MVRAPGEAAASIPARHGPALIAHMAGNTARQVRAAIEEVADFVEVDLWAHRGRLEARHARALYPLPLWFEEWTTVRRAPRRPFTLAGLLAETSGRTGVFLDLKNGRDEPARLVRAVLDSAGGFPGPLVASSQRWGTLRGLQQLVPEAGLYYSIDVRAKLDLFRSVMERDLRPAGISCRHTLLDEGIVQEMHDRGLKVVAWTVDEPARAEELAAWGADGITTHRVIELRSHLGLVR